jgi:hypothetical protein
VNLKNLMLIGIAAGAMAALVWLGLRLTSTPDAAVAPVAASYRATVTVAQGHVEVSPADSNASHPATPPDGLKDGDVVTTSANSSADVVFAGNNLVHLGPDSALVVGAHGGEVTSLGAVLLAGSAQITGGKQNIDFTIGTPLGVVQMPKDKLAEVSIRFDEGVRCSPAR